MYLRNVKHNDKLVNELQVVKTTTKGILDSVVLSVYTDESKIEDKIYINDQGYSGFGLFDYLVLVKDHTYNLCYWKEVIKVVDGSEQIYEFFLLIQPRDIDIQFRHTLRIKEDHSNVASNNIFNDMCDIVFITTDGLPMSLIGCMSTWIPLPEYIINLRGRYIKIEIVDKTRYSALIAKYKFMRSV